MDKWTDYCKVCSDPIYWFTRRTGWQHVAPHDHDAMPTYFGPDAPRHERGD